MALLAARMNDLQLCNTHGPAPLPDGARSVRINGKSTVRVGDAFGCGGCPNRVKTGASTVTIGGEFAARLTDQSDHAGWVTTGSTNVRIGGPRGMGCVGAGKSLCQAMAAGRKSGQTHQSYGNCVLESVRQIRRQATGTDITEDEMLRLAEERRKAYKRYAEQQGGPVEPEPGSVPDSERGGSDGDAGCALLNDWGVPAERFPPDKKAPGLNDLKNLISDRRGVVAFVDPHQISPNLYPDSGNHAVVVIGVEVDDKGQVTAVYINDTGAGECGKKVPAAVFASALQNLPSHKDVGGAPLIVTKGPIW
ncbi:MAG: PAAR domain-containing protein [Polyangiaceae bacterium]|nr:PAAR domain-containing protein [Polyangiaceae bacterium]